MIESGDAGAQAAARLILRRSFMGTLGLGMLTAHRRAHAQTSAKAPRIGWLSGGFGAQQQSPYFRAFKQGLRDLGCVIGQNVCDRPARAAGEKLTPIAILSALPDAHSFSGPPGRADILENDVGSLDEALPFDGVVYELELAIGEQCLAQFGKRLDVL